MLREMTHFLKESRETEKTMQVGKKNGRNYLSKEGSSALISWFFFLLQFV